MASSATEMAIFQRVAERGSFAGAAEDVGLSPSAVAKLITRLEQRLGVRLINRTTRHLALTAEGEIYLDRVREILGAIEAAERKPGAQPSVGRDRPTDRRQKATRELRPSGL
jgi:DNA-binding transcriptional LysR family regulator